MGSFDNYPFNCLIPSDAFCCISTGEFHFPNEEAAEIAWETIRDFLRANNGIERIIFNVYKDRDKEIYEKTLGLKQPNTKH